MTGAIGHEDFGERSFGLIVTILKQQITQLYLVNNSYLCSSQVSHTVTLKAFQLKSPRDREASDDNKC